MHRRPLQTLPFQELRTKHLDFQIMMMECSELSEDLISIINKHVRFEEYKERIGSKFTCKTLTQKNKSNKKNKIILSVKSDLLISLHGLTELEMNMLKDNVLNKESVFEEWQFQGFNLLVKLHRPLLYSKLFEQLLNTKMYVFSECCKRIALSKNNLNICQKNNLNHLRQRFFHDCIVNLLQFCGYEIFLHQTSNIEEEDISLGNHLLNKAKQLVSTKDSLKISNETLINDSSEFIAVNCFNKIENDHVNVSDVNDAFTLKVNKVISSEKFSRDGYDSNINIIPVLHSNKEWSSVFKNVIFLESCIKKNFSLDLDVYVYVLLEKELFCTQQTILLWKTIGDYSPNNVVHCVVGNTLVEDGVKQFTADEFYSSVYNLVKTSASHKKENSTEDIEWKVKADLITDACLKFKFLSSCIWSSVRINSETLHNDCVKPGSFIMYNYSRLSSILNRYERNVKAGIYPELPSVAEIDVSLLYRDDEWNLLVHYVAAFPCLIEEIVASVVNSDRISSKVPIHKLYLFLLNLSHEVSSYYCAVHILVEPVPHLMQLMFSRLLLIKSVHQVMRNIFTILDIKPVEQM